MHRAPRACVPCRKAHTACNRVRPCSRCVALGKPDECIDTEAAKKRGRPKKQHSTPPSTTKDDASPASSSSSSSAAPVPDTSAIKSPAPAVALPNQRPKGHSAREGGALPASGTKPAHATPLGSFPSPLIPPTAFGHLRSPIQTGLYSSPTFKPTGNRTSVHLKADQRPPLVNTTINPATERNTDANTTATGKRNLDPKIADTTVSTDSGMPADGSDNDEESDAAQDSMLSSVAALLLEQVRELKSVMHDMKCEQTMLQQEVSELKKYQDDQEDQYNMLEKKLNTLNTHLQSPPTTPFYPPLSAPSPPILHSNTKNDILSHIPILSTLVTDSSQLALDDLRKPFAIIRKSSSYSFKTHFWEAMDKNRPVVVYANEPFCTIIKYTPNELMGYNLYNILIPDYGTMSRFFPFALQNSSSQLSPEIPMDSIFIARDGQLVKVSTTAQIFYENGEAAGSILVIKSFEYQNSYHHARTQNGKSNNALSLSSVVEKTSELGKRHMEMEGRIEKRVRGDVDDRVTFGVAGLSRTASSTVSTAVDARKEAKPDQMEREGKEHHHHHHHERYEGFLIRGEQSPKVQPGNFSWLLHHENSRTQAAVSSSDSSKQGGSTEDAYWRFYKT